MTEQKSLKRRVRARMSRTGERYTAARRQVLATTSRPAPDRHVPPPGMTSDETMRSRTGRGWADWIRILDGWGAESRPHVEIARWLNQDQGVDGWWSQQITVGYELAIGRRVLGQRSDGRFTATAARTIGVPVEQLQEAVTDDGLREHWLPRAPLRARASKADRTARFDWEDGSSRVVFWFEAVGDARARVVMEHERLPDAGTAAEMKAYWRSGLARLKELVEG